MVLLQLYFQQKQLDISALPTAFETWLELIYTNE